MPIRMDKELSFDLFSYGRRGPGQRVQLSKGEIEQIARTARRTPEVMVKVLPKGANNLGAVRRHFSYIGREGALDVETDDGERLRGDDVGEDLAENWDLDVMAQRGKLDLGTPTGKQAPRLVHKVMFSMAAGTPPDKVLAAVRNFAREEFALKHRYAMALHTDEPHPHVHVVIKAVSDQGQRLNIRKATLREWRAEFARHLRALGVPANATPRHVRGETCPHKSDGIYRASLRGESTHIRERAEAVARELKAGVLRVESGKAKVVRTHNDVRRAWLAVSDVLTQEKQPELAAQVRRYAEQLPPPFTEKEKLAARILEHARKLPVHERQISR
ncbi:MAG TPA: relaxase/mobilization nuclease domain-containing protein [Candidatus Binataceae bacterium]|nr:relaxase/mobilization nuclease domain-containing protein [Candidatus Binataceae bacterium]